MFDDVKESVQAETLEAVMKLARQHSESILKDTKEGVLNTAVMRLPFDGRVYFDHRLNEKLKFTGFMKNLEHKNYELDLNELWLHLTLDEIRMFFKTVFDQVRRVEVDIADTRVTYTSPEFAAGEVRLV